MQAEKEVEGGTMIIIGYQGIGKTSVSCVENGCIDLESSNFNINGKRHEDWYVPYCRIALELSHQGFIVFTSSHKEVREYLVRCINQTKIVTMYPETYLETDWIARLQNRYDNDPSDKNYKALMNAKDRFRENVEEMKNWGGYCYGLDSMDYDLAEIVRGLI